MPWRQGVPAGVGFGPVGFEKKMGQSFDTVGNWVAFVLIAWSLAILVDCVFCFCWAFPVHLPFFLFYRICPALSLEGFIGHHPILHPDELKGERVFGFLCIGLLLGVFFAFSFSLWLALHSWPLGVGCGNWDLRTCVCVCLNIIYIVYTQLYTPLPINGLMTIPFYGNIAMFLTWHMWPAKFWRWESSLPTKSPILCPWGSRLGSPAKNIELSCLFRLRDKQPLQRFLPKLSRAWSEAAAVSFSPCMKSCPSPSLECKAHQVPHQTHFMKHLQPSRLLGDGFPGQWHIGLVINFHKS